eukprot:Phypoly_transcript_12792.p1 GENE.Phypoly_transcript_12792~~Phypoly_transcript_12792.p1  ORF type:complete len:252 (+),score=40.99 Phypoly_transcript_12792:316-1071(+)
MDVVAVVTGANRGLGLLVSRKLLQTGARVVLTARDPSNASLLAELKKEGFKADFHQLDVTNTDSISNFVQYMQKTYKKCNILCNNAGIFTSGWTAETFNKIMGTNFIGPVKLTQAMLPLLQVEDKGRIINVSSGYGKLSCLSEQYKQKITKATSYEELINLPFVKEDEIGKTEYPCYKISKAALNAFTVLLAKEFPNLLVNSVDPGWCKTDMGGQAAPREAEKGAQGIFDIAMKDLNESGKVFYDCKIQSL